MATSAKITGTCFVLSSPPPPKVWNGVKGPLLTVKIKALLLSNDQ